MGTTNATHACELGSLGPRKVPAGRETFLCRGGLREQGPHTTTSLREVLAPGRFLVCISCSSFVLLQ